MSKSKIVLFWIISLTWGLINSIVGLLTALVLIICGHKPQLLYGRIVFNVGYHWGGVSLGPVIVTQNYVTLHTTLHELGHSIQHLIWGPLFFIVIGIPSAIRYHYRNYIRKKKPQKELPDYDATWFEGQATAWGNKYFKEN